jgi:uncharacterized protein
VSAGFDPGEFPPGSKQALELPLAGAASAWSLPILLVRGSTPGKRLVATAGVHGDEFEGVRAIFDLYHELDPAEMAGDFLAVPVAHPPAFWNKSRTSPVDGGNLAREFPGSLEKSCTSAIAWSLGRSIIAHANFYLDLHSAGIHLNMPRLVGYDARDARSRDAAFAFGSRILWAHGDSGIGRTVSFAADRGIPYLYTEAQGAGRIDPDDLRFYKQGVVNMLRHLEILPGAPVTVAVELHLEGEGDIDYGIQSSALGFLIPRVSLLQNVNAGEELGILCNLRGETVERYHAPADGIIVLIRAVPVVEPGDMLFHITGVLNQ